jgi:glutamate N-acetyltransferase / amino-acid N-acetyltransferase
MSKSLIQSPLAPATLVEAGPVSGVELGACYAGIRYKPGRDDLLVVQVAADTKVAGVFTKSLTASPAVEWCRAAMAKSGGAARVLVVAAGNSLAGTGADGRAACALMARDIAARFGCTPEEVQISATGVIGEPFPSARLLAGVPLAKANPVDFRTAAKAICTTDTFPKLVTRSALIGGAQVTLTGFVKGSGMIQPNMATMLGYIFTDVKIDAALLQKMLSAVCEVTFNCITVDSDTSTSDTIQVFATGQSAIEINAQTAAAFQVLLHDVCMDLAHMVVKDGEGAQKFITVAIRGAHSFEDARIIGLSIANSPLVKTAIAGGDANWGRIVMAVGKAGPHIDPDKLSISFGSTLICKNGIRVKDYDEAPVVAHINGQEILITVDVGVGNGVATVYTCDLTHGYISINADYRS